MRHELQLPVLSGVEPRVPRHRTLERAERANEPGEQVEGDVQGGAERVAFVGTGVISIS